MIVWGNHSSTMFPDLTHATLLDYNTNSLASVRDLVDENWARGELLQVRWLAQKVNQQKVSAVHETVADP